MRMHGRAVRIDPASLSAVALSVLQRRDPIGFSKKLDIVRFIVISYTLTQFRDPDI